MSTTLTIVLLCIFLLLLVLARYTNLFKTVPGQEINWGSLAKDCFQYLLAALITVGFFGAIYYLLTKPIPVDNKTELDLMLGGLMGAFTGGIVGFFFGSSKGSQAKDSTIANLSNGG
jgi:uncharacterized BrkB/YihY/UPF0761 family membrane protein